MAARSNGQADSGLLARADNDPPPAYGSGGSGGGGKKKGDDKPTPAYGSGAGKSKKPDLPTIKEESEPESGGEGKGKKGKK